MHQAFAGGINFAERLRRRGYVQIGHGCYGVAMAKSDRDRIIKISYGNGDAWQYYIQWAVDNGYAGTLAPAVYSIHHMNGFTVAVIERLKSIYDVEGGYDKYAELKGALYNEELIEPWKSFFENLETFREGIGAGDDLHSQNFMMRANGDLVATDPLSSTGRKVASSRRYRSTARLAA